MKSGTGGAIMQEGISRNQGQAGLYAEKNFTKSETGGAIMQEGIS